VNLKHSAFIPLLLILILDQTTKALARIYLTEQSVIEVWPGHIRLQLAFNSGAFLSFGSQWSDGLRGLVFIVFVMVFLFFLWKMMTSPKSNRAQKICYSLVLGGGLGNLIDRIYLGAVADFLWIGFGALQTGIFNVADVAILFGVLFLIFEDLIIRKFAGKTAIKNSSQ